MWKDIPGWVGWYQASSEGQIRSIDRWVTFTDGRRRFYKGKVLAEYPGVASYRRVTLKQKTKSLRENIHVLIALTFIGPRPPGLVICHNDSNGANNCASNLRYDSYTNNTMDRAAYGTLYECSPHRLPDDLVHKIRKAKGEDTYRKLAERFGVSQTTVFNLQNGHRRKHCKPLC